jgi:hypothetical protein
LSRPVITFTVSFRRMSTRLCAVVAVAISNLESYSSLLQSLVVSRLSLPMTNDNRPTTL